MTEAEKIEKIVEWILELPTSEWVSDGAHCFVCVAKNGIPVKLLDIGNSHICAEVLGESIYADSRDTLRKLFYQIRDAKMAEAKKIRNDTFDRVIEIIQE